MRDVMTVEVGAIEDESVGKGEEDSGCDADAERLKKLSWGVGLVREGDGEVCEELDDARVEDGEVTVTDPGFDVVELLLLKKADETAGGFNVEAVPSVQVLVGDEKTPRELEDWNSVGTKIISAAEMDEMTN
jgi:hypothetical protein